jgi:DNA-binding ferritin-like protein
LSLASAYIKNIQELVIKYIQRHIVEFKRDIQELMLKNMQRHAAKLTLQLVEVRSLGDRKKSDHVSMDSFEKRYQRHEKRKWFFDQDEYDVETRSFYYYNFFMDWNQP